MVGYITLVGFVDFVGDWLRKDFKMIPENRLSQKTMFFDFISVHSKFTKLANIKGYTQ